MKAMPEVVKKLLRVADSMKLGDFAGDARHCRSRRGARARTIRVESLIFELSGRRAE
jgi:hypothetical protein